MFIELQLKETSEKIAVNMSTIQTISNSIRTKGFTMLVFDTKNDKDYLEVFESYDFIMAKVRAAQ